MIKPNEYGRIGSEQLPRSSKAGRRWVFTPLTALQAHAQTTAADETHAARVSQLALDLDACTSTRRKAPAHRPEPLELAGERALTRPPADRPSKSWVLRVYYICDAGDLVCADFGGLTQQRAEALAAAHRQTRASNGSDAVDAEAHPLLECRVNGRTRLAASDVSVQLGARRVKWPSAAPAEPVLDPVDFPMLSAL